MTFRFALLSLAVCLLLGCETTEQKTCSYLSNCSGFEQKAGLFGNKALVRKNDSDQLERYERVIIEDVRVIPSEDETSQRVTREETERLAERFEEILEEELGKDYEITQHRSRQTLTVRAALTELRPSRPGLFAVNYLPYAGAVATGVQVLSKKEQALGAGTTSVEIEVLDSRSRRQLFGMVDQLSGSKFQPGSLEKWGQAEGSMRIWARRVHRAIRSETPQPALVSTSTDSDRESSDDADSDSEGERKRLFPLAGRSESDKEDGEARTPLLDRLRQQPIDSQ